MAFHRGIALWSFPLRLVCSISSERPRDLSVLARGVGRVHALLSDRAGSVRISRPIDPASVAFRTRLTASAPGFGRLFAAQSHRLHTPCQRFGLPLTVQPHDSGPGWFPFLLSCVRLSLTTPRRFIPTLQAGTPALPLTLRTGHPLTANAP